MKSTKLIIGSILSLAVLLGSCGKEEIVKEDANPDNNKTPFVNPMEHVGTTHNDDLTFILQNITSQPPTGEMAQRSYVEGILSAKYSSSDLLADLPVFGTSYADLDIATWLSSFALSPEMNEQIMITTAQMEAAANLNDIITDIETREVEASSIFSGTELSRYYEHLAVAKATATFWAPVAEGGLDGISYLGYDIGVGGPAGAIDWWKVLACDCIGGAAGGPAGYAAASAISVIMQS